MNTFKVGDIVVFHSSPGGTNVEVGDIGEIIEVRTDLVLVRATENKVVWAMYERLEVIDAKLSIDN